MKYIQIILLLLLFTTHADPLPSWNDGPIKTALIEFVQKENIPQEERIATFDQDGTLWVEQPLNTQLFFAIDTIKELAPKHPEWKNTEPFKTILSGDLKDLDFSENNIAHIIAVTHSGISVAEFEEKVKKWLETAIHPRFKRPFTELVYQPMIEVIQLFKDHGFKIYIVSGAGQEFIRAYAEKVYGVPPEQVIGTAGKTKYEYQNGNPILLKLPEVLFVDVKQGKPQSINLIIGRRPVAAFGNSTGDQQMLEWTQGFKLLVHHDDPVREYAYDVDSKIGHFPKSLMDEALKLKWHVVSMKNDWKVIFSPQRTQRGSLTYK